MNFLNPMLCLFLILGQVNFSNLDSQISMIEKKLELVDQNSVSDLSKEISKLVMKLDQEEQELTKEIKENQKIKKACQKREKKIHQKLRLEKKEKSFFLIKRIIQSKKMEKENDKIKQLKKEIRKRNKKIKRQKSKQAKVQSYLSRLNACQNQIGEKYQEYFNRVQTGGQANLNQMVQGNTDLPAYGSIYASQDQSSLSCLWNGSYALDGASESWLPFIKNGTISAGTWAYPNGGMHLGLDVAASLYSPIFAGANGIVLYADAPVDSNCGYLGNYCGWPQGGGNTICMIMAVQDAIYGVSLNHLSNQLCVVAGQQFHQGDLLAYSGNSGNSTGPHTHIEVFQLKVSLAEAVSYFQRGADFSFGCGWRAPATCSAIACRVRPEEVF